MIKEQLSGLVLTHGERDPAPQVEQLLEVASQVVLVADGYRATERAHELGATVVGGEITVVERAFDTFPDQRNVGIEKAVGEWVLALDSDEKLSDNLQAEIIDLEPDADTDVFAIPRRELFGGRAQRGRLYGPHPRLFRSHLRYAPQPVVHERFEDFGSLNIEDLQHELLHFPVEGRLSLLKKSFTYGRQMAEHGGAAEEFGWKQTLTTLPRRLVHGGYWRDGFNGAMLAAMEAAYRLGTK